MTAVAVEGLLVLEDRVARGRVSVSDGVITDVDHDDEPGAGGTDAPPVPDAPVIAPGFCDVHVHGFGGNDAMAGRRDLDGMARALLRRGVTSFLPTAVTAPLDRLSSFADVVRAWIPAAPPDGAAPLGFNLEGPFLAPERRGAHDGRFLLIPDDVPRDRLEPLLDSLRVITVAPELPGAADLIEWLAGHGVTVSAGHSAAELDAARRAYAAGARSTTHLFNAMTGVDHRAPGLAVAALTSDDAYVELIADGNHVHPSLWPIVLRTKPSGRVLLVSDALPPAGTDATRGTIGGLEVEIRDERCVLLGSNTLAGSVIALDAALRNLVQHGFPLPTAVAAASTNPAALLGAADRGRIVTGARADLVELSPDLRVQRVMRGGEWVPDP
jgi:N-acetylglucosamine-6-phosphate deacetylase